MHHHRCDMCGAAASVHFASLDAWLCATCATTVSRARRHATRQERAGRIVLDVAPRAIRRTERDVVGHLRLN